MPAMSLIFINYCDVKVNVSENIYGDALTQKVRRKLVQYNLHVCYYIYFESVEYFKFKSSQDVILTVFMGFQISNFEDILKIIITKIECFLDTSIQIYIYQLTQFKIISVLILLLIVKCIISEQLKLIYMGPNYSVSY